MPLIQVLDTHLINKIAAGEVVERPSSVVKELCENAIDAGAGAVRVEIMEGGLTLIRVTDNGRGIPPDEAPTAFLRHATSKLRDIEGLERIVTLGFRGEALSSIAAVSMSEMITKTEDSDTGIKIAVHGGVALPPSEEAAPNGTSITVRNLFYNTPARRKFLKKPGTEGAYAAEIVTRLALGRPDVAMTFINSGVTVFSTSGDGSPRNAALSVYGRETASKFLDVSYQRGLIRVTGLAGKPELSRGNRGHQVFFVNGRHIKNSTVQSAVESAYKTRLTIGKFPVYILYLEIPPDLVDVNVHPAKLEARFSRDVDIYRIMLGAAESALGGKFLVPSAAAENKTVDGKSRFLPASLPAAPRHFEPPECTPQVIKAQPEYKTIQEYSKVAVCEPQTPYSTSEIKKEMPGSTYIYNEPTAHVLDEYRIVGQFFGTYWLIELYNGSACYLMDQHAAHERVLYDEISEKLYNSGAIGQRVIEPIAVNLSPQEKQTVMDNLQLFNNMGFEIEDMYDSNIALRSVPYIFQAPADGGFFMELVDALDEDGKAGSAEGMEFMYKARLETVSRLACKAAVKANDRLSQREARVLVERVLTLENPFTCPHGRPVMIELTRRDLEKMFKRVQ